jgi:hypothetical protein
MGRHRPRRVARETDVLGQRRLPSLLLGRRSAPGRPAAHVGESPRPASLALVRELLRAHEEGLALCRGLMVAQGIADETESEAVQAFDRAAARPWDEELADRAVAAAAASEAASERELELAAQWGCHCAWTRGLIEQARALLSISEPLCEGDARL